TKKQAVRCERYPSVYRRVENALYMDVQRVEGRRNVVQRRYQRVKLLVPRADEADFAFRRMHKVHEILPGREIPLLDNRRKRNAVVHLADEIEIHGLFAISSVEWWCGRQTEHHHVHAVQHLLQHLRPEGDKMMTLVEDEQSE